MKSKKAQEFIDRAMKHIVADLSDHGKWQLRTAMATTAEQINKHGCIVKLG